jgi:FtsP/CotA-like multicopper oxidase with cupredoxin domain
MTYLWYFNTNAPVFSPSAFATLSLPNVTAQSAGFYSVLITNAFGSVTSSMASLTVVTPSITGATRNADGSVTLTFVGLPNAASRIWATTNLALPASWQPIFTNTTTSTNGTWQFIDTNATGYPWRFYRFSIP